MKWKNEIVRERKKGFVILLAKTSHETLDETETEGEVHCEGIINIFSAKEVFCETLGCCVTIKGKKCFAYVQDKNYNLILLFKIIRPRW